MSAKSCDNYKMIMISYADLWLVHSHIASLLDGARLELREIKAHSTLRGACTTCPLLRSDLKTAIVEIKDLKYKLDHSSRYTVLSLHVKHVPLSRVSFSMLPKRTPSFSRMSLICLHILRKPF
jgi:Fe-S cluster biogenesis protein NfuA